MAEENDLSLGPEFEPAESRLLHLNLGRSFLAGPHPAQDIMQVRWYTPEGSNDLVGRVWWGPGAQGPPGHAHGGSMAAILDEALGGACLVAGHPVLAAQLNTRFRTPLPLEAVYTVHGRIERQEGRKYYAVGHIEDDEGTIYAEADGLFIALPHARFEELAGV